ncbi:hypothetical protein, partial [uncultured Sphingomonas sp.]|uniref:hypothetical protein n=1 Tax=uncultured Sphingomonas sp. TaxID=158754 RepID=UPI00261B0032
NAHPAAARHGSLASWRPLRVAHSLRLARAGEAVDSGPHGLARIAVIPCGMTGLLRLAHAAGLPRIGTARSRRGDPFGSPTRYASHAPIDAL